MGELSHHWILFCIQYLKILACKCVTELFGILNMVYIVRAVFLEDMRRFFGSLKQKIMFLILIQYEFHKNIQAKNISKDQKLDNIHVTHWGKIQVIFG